MQANILLTSRPANAIECLDSFLEPGHIDMSRLLSSLVFCHLQLHHGTLTAPSFRAPTAVLLWKFLREQRMVGDAQWPAVLESHYKSNYEQLYRLRKPDLSRKKKSVQNACSQGPNGESTSKEIRKVKQRFIIFKNDFRCYWQNNKNWQ